MRFAISLNQSFPQQDVDDISESIGSFCFQQDYVRTPSGVAPIFVFSKGWSGVYGSDEAAKQVVQRIKDTVYKQSGVKLLFILEYPDPAAAAEQARKSGMDMTTAYATFAPGQLGRTRSRTAWPIVLRIGSVPRSNFSFHPERHARMGPAPKRLDQTRRRKRRSGQNVVRCGS